MAEVQTVHVGLGPIGREIARLARARPDLRPVAAIDVDPELTGRSLGDLLGEPEPAGADDVRVATSLAALDAGAGGVAIVATGSSLERTAQQIFDCVDASLHVVSTCEELSFPWIQHPSLAAEIDARARSAGVVVLGTGINPGFAMDYLPLALAGACSRVDFVRVHRVQDAGARRLPLQRKVGAGMSPEEFAERAAAGTIGHVGLVESAHAIADGFSWPVSDTRETIEPVIAAEDVRADAGLIRAGRVAGIRQRATVSTDGEPVVELLLEMAVGLESKDEVELRGESCTSMVVEGGLHGDSGTAAVVVNAIPRLASCRPGLRVMTDLPAA